MSSAVDRATSQKVLPFTGDGFSKYWPFVGAIHLPPMKFSYRDSNDMMAPSAPGLAKTGIGCSPSLP